MFYSHPSQLYLQIAPLLSKILQSKVSKKLRCFASLFFFFLLLVFKGFLMLSSLSWCGLPMAAAPWWYIYHSGMVGLHSHVSSSHCLWIQMYIHLSWAVSSSSLVAVFSFIVYITCRTSETSLDGYRLIHDMIPPQPCSLPHASYSCLLLLQFYAPNMLAYQYKDQAPTKNKVQGDKEPKYMLDKICHFQIA